MPVIRLSRLTKCYGPVRALDGLTADLEGGAMGLLGPNGAGKTTLLKTLLGLVTANEGRAEVLGLDTARSPLELRGRVGYMPEADCYVPGMSGVRFVAYAGRLTGLPRRDALTRAHEVLHYVGLGEVRYRKVDQYSQGMRQRLRLAKALVHDPELLFLDEPTSGLDPRGRDEMLDLVADLTTRHGKHVLLSSHLLPDVEAVCSDVVVLNRGRIAGAGVVSDLLGPVTGVYEAWIRGDAAAVARGVVEGGGEVLSESEGRLRLRLDDDPILVFRAALEAGAEVRELRETATSLEDAFRALLESGETA